MKSNTIAKKIQIFKGNSEKQIQNTVWKSLDEKYTECPWKVLPQIVEA